MLHPKKVSKSSSRNKARRKPFSALTHKKNSNISCFINNFYLKVNIIFSCIHIILYTLDRLAFKLRKGIVICVQPLVLSKLSIVKNFVYKS